MSVLGLWLGHTTGSWFGPTSTPAPPPVVTVSDAGSISGGSRRRRKALGTYKKDYLAELLERTVSDDNEVLRLVARAYMELIRDE